MKRYLWILFAGLMLLSSCKKSAAPAPPRLVCRITVTAPDGTAAAYTQPEKLRRMLTYLRSLDPGSSLPAPPEKHGKEYRITLCRTDGSQLTYLLADHRYLRRGEGPWRGIAHDRAAKLPLLLKAMPPDG